MLACFVSFNAQAPDEVSSEPDFFRGVLGELVLTFLWVFSGVGAAVTDCMQLTIPSNACTYSMDGANPLAASGSVAQRG